jgi:signal transduction histidine kinase
MSRELSNLGANMNIMANKLEQADIEQKTFFQNASHELRTPLMSIQGYAEGIKYDIFDEDQRSGAIDVIINETTRLTTLVENLLSISKMDMSRSGTFTVKKTIVNVQEISEDIVARVRE